MSIDWSKAPEATHYAFAQFPWNASWYIVKGDNIAAMLDDGEDDEWAWRPIDSQDRECILPRLVARPVEPAAPAWTGEGLPPVGTVCEYQKWVNREWKQTKVLAHHLGFAVHSWSVDGDDMEVDSAPPQDFRPIVTPEQIEAEERLAAINYMEIDAGMCATAFDGDPEARVWIENLIDKGWRKKVAP